MKIKQYPLASRRVRTRIIHYFLTRKKIKLLILCKSWKYIIIPDDGELTNDLSIRNFGSCSEKVG